MNVKYYLIFIIALFWVGSAKAQEEWTEICIDFRLNSHAIDSTYMDNAIRLDEIMSVFRELRRDTTLVVTKVTFSGVSSPEGHSKINQRLAEERMLALEKYVRSHITLPDSIVVHHDNHYIPWQYLISEVESSDISHKEEVLSILRLPQKYIPYYNNTSIDSRVPALQELDGGRVWRMLNKRFFAKMRNACAVLVMVKKQQPVVPDPQPQLELQSEPEDTVVVVMEETLPDPVEPVITESKDRQRHVYLKTNAVGWGMLIANIAVEADLAEHWSFTLPFYYSALNYFSSDVKFRTACIQPEVRYWLSEENQGWFAGAHFGLGWFNYAKGGDWRYQDHNRNTPLMGGGLSGGYRLSVSKNHKWFMEFSLGTGVYKLHYDVFHNEPNGQRIDTRKRMFFGIDQAAVSFAYRFDWKKGGKR
jgi:hypothetical protein